MEKEIERRLDAIENRSLDWANKLDTVDYGVLEVSYENDVWEELHHDNFITVVRHRETKEVRGYCRDRRSEQEILAEGGLLEFL